MEWWAEAAYEAGTGKCTDRWKKVGQGFRDLKRFWREEFSLQTLSDIKEGLKADSEARDALLADLAVALITGKLATELFPSRQASVAARNAGAGIRETAGTGAPAFKTWNQFQSGTAGQFASRAEAGAAWSVYKEANGIVTGATRSTAARGEFLRGMAESGKSPSWMNQWLQQGKVPPGYHVDHIKPLSIGGADTPANMRLLDIDMHKMHHRFYRPWEL